MNEQESKEDLVLEALKGLTTITEKLGSIIEKHQSLIGVMHDRISQLERGE